MKFNEYSMLRNEFQSRFAVALDHLNVPHTQRFSIAAQKENIVIRKMCAWCLVPLLLIFMACASYAYWEAKACLQQGNYASAISKFIEAESEHPADFRIKRDLGIAYFQIRDYDRAIEKLSAAKNLKPADGLTILHLGLCYEALQNLNQALAEYSRLTSLNKFSSIRSRIELRMKDIMRKKIAAEVQQAIRDEQKLVATAAPENSIAILYFKNINQWDKLNPLEKGLAIMLTTDFSKVERLKIIERMKLEHLIAELKLSQSDLLDAQTAPRLGKLLGARKLVKGGFITSEEGYLQIIAAIVESGETDAPAVEAQADGRLNDFFRLEKKLVFQMIKEMGIRLTSSEIENIKKVPTANLMAFLAFSEGLDFEDKGDLGQAKNSYRRALTLDPDFQMVGERLQGMTSARPSEAQLIRMVQAVDSRTPTTRLAASAQTITPGFIPRENDASAIVRPALDGGKGTLVVTGSLPQIESATAKKP